MHLGREPGLLGLAVPGLPVQAARPRRGLLPSPATDSAPWLASCLVGVLETHDEVEPCVGHDSKNPHTTRLVLSLPPHPSNLWTAPTARCKRLGQQHIHGIPWG